MKTSDRIVKKKKNQLGKHLFTYIVVILFALLVVFSVFENLNLFSLSAQEEMEEEEIKTKMLLKAINDSKTVTEESDKDRTSEIYVWGDKTEAISVVKTQLSNMKVSFEIAETLEMCKNAQILFIGDRKFSNEEIRVLQGYCQKGMTLFFTEFPEESLLKQETVQNLLGIDSYDGAKTEKGIRITEKILYGDCRESEEEFSLNVVTLQQRTEVYVSALQEENEEIKEKISRKDTEPLFWRYKPEGSSGNVYVADKKLMTDATGYAIVAFLFEDIYQTYMYPIVNAYCFMIAGMPYGEEIESEYLQEVYGRNAIGIESDIFFPEWNRCKDRYDLTITWYAREKVSGTSNAVMEYYLNNMDENREVVGQINEEKGTMDVTSVFDNTLLKWNPDFRWIMGEQVQIPYHSLEIEKYQSDLVKDLCWMKGTGFSSVFVDVQQFLREEDGEDWIDFAKSLETVLGVEKQNTPWLERMSVKDAIYRIMAYQIMQPEILYEENRIDLSIQNFAGEAYFCLTTQEIISEAENAEVEQIAEDTYLVKVTNKTATIFFDK